jgi:hypothetical protein
MFHRVTTSLMLACYSVIALFGQGLHSFMEAHADVAADHHRLPSVASLHVAECGAGTIREVAIDSPDNHSEHDCDHCAICQHQSLGQIFVATPPVKIVLAACDYHSLPAPKSVLGPALFSVAQPRAPPAVI